jgi:acetyl esterase/lipase
MFKPLAEMKTDSVDLGGVPGEWITFPQVAGGRTILYLHGGFYLLGSIQTHRSLVGYIAAAAQAHALIIAYRLAPEHPFPAALDDAYTAYSWLLAHDTQPEQIILMGDSAGGGLVLSLLLTLREQGIALPAAAVFLSPWTDLSLSGESWKTNAKKDLMINPRIAEVVPSLYIPGADPCQPLASPLFADLRGLPPMLIQVGSDERLLSDSTRLAERARLAGADVTLEVWPKMPHVWQFAARVLPEARQAVDRIGEFVSSVNG